MSFASWSVFQLLYTVNLSRGGMTLALPAAPAVGSTLAVRVQLPDAGEIELDAVVRHASRLPGAADDYQVGVEFTDLDDRKRAEIEAMLKAHTR